VIISAWLVPIFVVGQFAMVAVLPVALVLIGTLRDARLRTLRWWSVGSPLPPPSRRPSK